MEDIQLLEAIERYLGGQMDATEKAYFEDLRNSNPEIDQMVVEHNMYLHLMDQYAQRIELKHTLHQVHEKLTTIGAIDETSTPDTGKVIQLWSKYKRVTAIAAAAGGTIALIISALSTYFSPNINPSQIQALSKKITILEGKLNAEIKKGATKVPEGATFTSGGTGFLVDGKGYLVTNAHVLKNATATVVINSKGEAFKAEILLKDDAKDLAILKIKDSDFKNVKNLPYGIAKNAAPLGEEIYTLGYPRNEIVYNFGHLSAKTGYKGDSLSYQIQMSANPGNSGGPVFNRKGEVIGIINSRQTEGVGISFAITSKNIYNLLQEVKKSDTAVQKIKLNANSQIRQKNRTDQVKEIEPYVFSIKAYNQ